MHTTNIKRFMILCVVSFILSFALTGCFKGNVSVDIKSNGSGIVSFSFGMTQQAKALVSSQDSNFTQGIEQVMSIGDESTPTDVNVTRWVDGDYEWAKVEKEFGSLDEINKVQILNEGLFNHFSLTRKRGILQDEFILDAELDALNSDIPSDNSGVDPSAFIVMSFSASLPGKIVESNGLVDVNNPNRIVWNAEGNQPVSVKARSVTWNWLNIFGIIAVGFLFVLLVLLGIYMLGGFNNILISTTQNKKDSPQHQQPLQSQNENTNYIVDFNIENLLSQINTRALNSAGQFYKKPRQIALVWTDINGKQRFIDVKELEKNQIAINGQVYSATKENVKLGLISALQKQKV